MGFFRRRGLIGTIIRIVVLVLVAGVALFLLLRGIINSNIVS